MTNEERYLENEKLVRFVVNKFNIPYNHMDYEDFVGEGNFALWKAVMSYDTESTTAFSTYAYNVIKNHLSAYLNSKGVRDNKSYHDGSVSLDMEVGEDEDTLLSDIVSSNKPASDLCLKLYLDSLRKNTKSKNVKIFFDFYDGMTVKELSKKYNINEKSFYQYISLGRKELRERIGRDLGIEGEKNANKN